MALQISTREAGIVTIVELAGDIRLGDALGQLWETIRRLLAENRTRILLSLERVGYVDSSGTGYLKDCWVEVDKRGGRLGLLKPSKQVRDLLQITKLYTVFHVYTDEQEALAGFEPASPPPHILRRFCHE